MTGHLAAGGSRCRVLEGCDTTLGGDDLPEDAAESRCSPSASKVSCRFGSVAKSQLPAKLFTASVSRDIPGQETCEHFDVADGRRSCSGQPSYARLQLTSNGIGLRHAFYTVI